MRFFINTNKRNLIASRSRDTSASSKAPFTANDESEGPSSSKQTEAEQRNDYQQKKILIGRMGGKPKDSSVTPENKAQSRMFGMALRGVAMGARKSDKTAEHEKEKGTPPQIEAEKSEKKEILESENGIGGQQNAEAVNGNAKSKNIEPLVEPEKQNGPKTKKKKEAMEIYQPKGKRKKVDEKEKIKDEALDTEEKPPKMEQEGQLQIKGKKRQKIKPPDLNEKEEAKVERPDSIHEKQLTKGVTIKEESKSHQIKGKRKKIKPPDLNEHGIEEVKIKKQETKEVATKEERRPKQAKGKWNRIRAPDLNGNEMEEAKIEQPEGFPRQETKTISETEKVKAEEQNGQDFDDAEEAELAKRKKLESKERIHQIEATPTKEEEQKPQQNKGKRKKIEWNKVDLDMIIKRKPSLDVGPSMNTITHGMPRRTPRIMISLDGSRKLAPFFTNAFCFSNHFKCRFSVDGLDFCCTEQFYMYYKARVFGDEESERAILQCQEAREIKRMGARIRLFDTKMWRKVSILVMTIGNMRKYEQNPVLRRFLFETGDALLIEASPDDVYWGIGVHVDNPASIRDTRIWMRHGKNVLGRILTRIREEFKKREQYRDEWAEVEARLTAIQAEGGVPSRRTM